MTIAFYSPNFYPLVGGLENVVFDLAEELSKLGHNITVITNTEGDGTDEFSFQILRQPSGRVIRTIIKAADVFVQFNVSIPGTLQWLGTGTPLVVSHQGENPNNIKGKIRISIANNLARKNVACSQYIAHKYRHSVFVPNPYRHALFQNTTPIAQRSRDLVFLGRLVSDKGADLLLQAVRALRQEGAIVTASIIGSGPEASALQDYTYRYHLDEQIVFTGQKTGTALVELLNQHKIMVVPSRWQEPFGIVALEGIACGCYVIGSDGGGLPEAIGPCGITFPNGDLKALVSLLNDTFANFASVHARAQASAADHLVKHRKQEVAKAFLQEFEKVVNG